VTEPAQRVPEDGGRSSLRADVEPEISTTSSRLHKFARWLVIVFSAANLLMAVAILALMWSTIANPGTPLPTRINDSVSIVGGLLFAAVIFLIAWNAGNQPANLALALALALLNSGQLFDKLLEQLHASDAIRDLVGLPIFILFYGFWILAAARFPRKLTPADIASSGTIWGRIRPLRAVFVLFLRPPAVWGLVAISVILGTPPINNPVVAAVKGLATLLLVVIYFHIQYRSGDVETRKKVLWFFEFFLGWFVFILLRFGVQAVLPKDSSETLRAVVSVFFNTAGKIVPLFCICMAVFYAGAISPALVIRKTFVYGVTAALLLFTYATLEAFVVNIVVARTGINDQFASATLGAVLALAFHPIKNRMEHGLRHVGLSVAPRGTAPHQLDSHEPSRP